MKILQLFLFSLLSLYISCADAGGGGTVGGNGGALETTQYLNYGELFQQTNNTIQQLQYQMAQLENMKRQVEQLGSIPNITMAQQVLGDVARTVRQAQSLGYNSAALASKWSQQYPDFTQRSGVDYMKQYSTWSKETNGSIRSSLMVNGLQAENFQTEQSTADSLRGMITQAEGQQSVVASLRVGSEIAMNTQDELRKLRQLQMAQNQAQMTYLQGQQQVQDTKAAQDDVLRQMFSRRGAMTSYDELVRKNK